jgi:inner membrane protein
VPDFVNYEWWLIAGIIIMALEVFVGGTVILWFGIAALMVGTLLFVGVSLSLPWQWLVFSVVSLVSVIVWRMVVKRFEKPEMEHAKLSRRGEHYIGKVFTVVEPIQSGFGKIKIEDTLWRVRGADMPAGAKVRVVGIEGATLDVIQETMMTTKMKQVIAITLAVMLGACSSQTTNKNQPTVEQARANTKMYKGRDVSWGGKILSVKNNRKTTEVEIQSFGLTNTGKPRLSGSNSDGRFIAVFNGFQDPAVLAKGKNIRVNGIITGSMKRKLDSYTYHYPRVQATWHKVYNRRNNRSYNHGPTIYWGTWWGGHHRHRHGWGWGWGHVF